MAVVRRTGFVIAVIHGAVSHRRCGTKDMPGRWVGGGLFLPLFVGRVAMIVRHSESFLGAVVPPSP